MLPGAGEELLLPFATADQLTSLLDLDGWTQERLDIARSREWIHAISEHYANDDRPRGSLVDLMYTMDPEMWTLVIGVGMLVLELAVDEDDARDLQKAGVKRVYTPKDFDLTRIMGEIVDVVSELNAA